MSHMNRKSYILTRPVRVEVFALYNVSLINEQTYHIIRFYTEVGEIFI